MDGAGSGSWPVAVFGVVGVGPMGSATREGVSWLVSFTYKVFTRHALNVVHKGKMEK
jgi:hypothetical protein